MRTTEMMPNRVLLATFVLLATIATGTSAHVDRQIYDYTAFESCLLGSDVSTSNTGYQHDADFDGDVDLTDWASFQACYQSTSSVCLFAHDYDNTSLSDGSIDLADHTGFTACFNGPNTTPPPTCQRTIARGLRSTPPPTGTFALHGRPIDVLPDGKTLLYVRARYYDPANGRWLQRDPLGFGGGGNLYESFGSNPARFVDPQGELSEELVNFFVNDRFLSNDEIDRATSSGGVGLAQAQSRLLSDIGNATTALGDIDALLLVPQGFEQGFRQPAIGATSGRFQSLIAGQVAAGADIASASSNLTLTVFFIGDLTGATQLGEGLASVDLASNQVLSTGESFRRGVQGGSTIIIIAAGPKALRNARARSATLRAARLEAAAAGNVAASALRARVLANIAESQAARAASNFEVFAAREAGLSVAANSLARASLLRPITDPSRLLAPPEFVPNAGGKIISFVTTEDRVFFRVFSSKGRRLGRFLTAVPPRSAAFAREAFALPPGNEARFIQEVLVPAGTRLQRSRALPAFGRRGGAEQFELFTDIPNESFGPGGTFP